MYTVGPSISRLIVMLKTNTATQADFISKIVLTKGEPPKCPGCACFAKAAAWFSAAIDEYYFREKLL
jgi:hypothetical protein